jgi:hypothetical protein
MKEYIIKKNSNGMMEITEKVEHYDYLTCEYMPNYFVFSENFDTIEKCHEFIEKINRGQ